MLAPRPALAQRRDPNSMPAPLPCSIGSLRPTGRRQADSPQHLRLVLQVVVRCASGACSRRRSHSYPLGRTLRQRRAPRSSPIACHPTLQQHQPQRQSQAAAWCHAHLHHRAAVVVTVWRWQLNAPRRHRRRRCGPRTQRRVRVRVRVRRRGPAAAWRRAQALTRRRRRRRRSRNWRVPRVLGTEGTKPL